MLFNLSIDKEKPRESARQSMAKDIGMTNDKSAAAPAPPGR
jgi:hypothetical protein